MAFWRKNFHRMSLELKNIYQLKEVIVREGHDKYFWPEEFKNKNREDLILRNKKEAWFCQFLNNGLALNTEIYFKQDDFPLWKKNIKTLNPNTKFSNLEFLDSVNLSIDRPIALVRHLAKDSEFVRKRIYVSHHFLHRADQIWAAQYYAENEDRHFMYFAIGFYREIDDQDIAILDQIRTALSGIDDLQILKWCEYEK